MFNISSYLQKITKNLNSTELQKKQILQILKSNTQIDFQDDEVDFKNNTILLKTTMGRLNKVFLNKQSILEDFEKHSIVVRDVR